MVKTPSLPRFVKWSEYNVLMKKEAWNVPSFVIWRPKIDETSLLVDFLSLLFLDKDICAWIWTQSVGVLMHAVANPETNQWRAPMNSHPGMHSDWPASFTWLNTVNMRELMMVWLAIGGPMSLNSRMTSPLASTFAKSMTLLDLDNYGFVCWWTLIVSNGCPSRV